MINFLRIQYLSRLKADSHSKFNYLLLISFFSLFGCQSINESSIITPYISYNQFLEKHFFEDENKNLSGKFKLFIGSKGYSGSLKLSFEKNHHYIILLSPINQVISKIIINSNNEVAFDSHKDFTNQLKKNLSTKSISQLKKILYSKYDRELIIQINCCIVKINELKKIEGHNNFSPKKITIDKDNFNLMLLLN